jgi:putative lipoic acid-binding regulatory protein
VTKKPVILSQAIKAKSSGITQVGTAEEPKIEFPCDYPIKALGDNSVDLKALVIETVKQHAPDLDESRVTLNESSKGTFVSVRFNINATGPDQLKAIHEALMATGHVKMVI